LNLGAISKRFFPGDIGSGSAEFASRYIDSYWDRLNQSSIFENVTIFLLWAIAGVLALSLLTRLIQVFIKLFYSADDASKYVKAQRGFGIIFWIISLQDFFKRAVAVVAGLLCVYLGGLIGFSAASAQLRNWMWGEFPQNLLNLGLCFFMAVIGIRLLVSGFGLISPKFSRWYYA